MNDRPVLLHDYLFRDEFKVRGGALSDHWTVPLGEFSMDSEKYLQVVQPGELVYNGTSLDDLKIAFESDNANFAIVLRFFAREDMKFEIRGRREEDNSYTALSVDFETNVVSLSEVPLGSGGVILDSTTHNLKTDGIRYYSIELWMHETDIRGFINGAQIVSATSSANLTEMGFSLWVPEVYLDDPPIFNAMVVHELIEQNPRLLDGDASNLHVLFRDLMRDQIDDWAEDNRWPDFVKARRHWHLSRNIGYLNDTWRDLGYPFYQPRSESFYD